MDERINWDDVLGLQTDLKAMARKLLRRESKSPPLQTTSLVLTALRRLRRTDQSWDEVRWEDRDKFFAAAYTAMRRALIDYARTRMRTKERPFTDVLPEDLVLVDLRALNEKPEQVEALGIALEELQVARPELGSLIEHVMYSEMSIPEIARFLDESDRTVRERYRRARVILADRILRHLNPSKGRKTSHD